MGKVLLIIDAILVFVIIYLLMKHSRDSTKNDAVHYDLIVSIKVEPAPNIIQHAKIKDAATWQVYGEGVFRGRSPLTKEEMKRLLMEELCLLEENVIVVDATDSFVKLGV